MLRTGCADAGDEICTLQHVEERARSLLTCPAYEAARIQRCVYTGHAEGDAHKLRG